MTRGNKSLEKESNGAFTLRKWRPPTALPPRELVWLHLLRSSRQCLQATASNTKLKKDRTSVRQAPTAFYGNAPGTMNLYYLGIQSTGWMDPHRAKSTSDTSQGEGTQFSSVQFSRSVVSDSLRPHESQHARLPVHHQLRSSLILMSIESVMPSSHLILCCPLFLLPPIPPRSLLEKSKSKLQWCVQPHTSRMAITKNIHKQ